MIDLTRQTPKQKTEEPLGAVILYCVPFAALITWIILSGM